MVSFCVLRTEIAESPEYAIRLTPPWRISAHVTRFHEKIFIKTRELSQEKRMVIQEGAPQIHRAD